MSLLGVDLSDEHAATLRSLGNGECIFRDLDGRAGRMMVDLISDELRRWLDTNPTRARSGEAPLTHGRTGSARLAGDQPPGSGHPPGRMLGSGFPAASQEPPWMRPAAGPMQAGSFQPSQTQTPSQLARAD
jgi:hypothetical protein